VNPLGSFATQEVTVLRASTARDSHGNQARDWSSAAEHTLDGCLLVPVVGTELLTNRDEISTTFQLYARPGVDLLATDRVRDQAGVVYEVVGSVLRYQTGSGLDHTAALLTRWEG